MNNILLTARLKLKSKVINYTGKNISKIFNSIRFFLLVYNGSAMRSAGSRTPAFPARDSQNLSVLVLSCPA